MARAWTPIVTGDLRKRALTVAREVAGRVRDRNRLMEATEAAAKQTLYPKSVHWDPVSLAQGDAGIAVACDYFSRCFGDPDFKTAAHDYLARSAETYSRSHQAAIGMFGGLAGLAFVARTVSNNDARYRPLLVSIEGELCSKALYLASGFSGRHGFASSEFDLISGLSGVAAYLLMQDCMPPRDVALDAVVDGLVALTQAGSDAIPHWYTPAHLLPDNGMADLYPGGNLNCGLAHGIPGPLAAMAIALEQGVSVAHLSGAVSWTGRWLTQHRTNDQYGPNWPTVVPIASGKVQGTLLDSSRAAWCYGTPGVARALWIAGRAIGDESIRLAAIEGMAAVYKRPIPERRIDSPTFCHGVAGLLQVTVRFANETGLQVFTDAARELCNQLLASYAPERRLGFAALEPRGNPVDQPGLLDGAPGVAMALLAATTEIEPQWDRAFLLS
jgi:lantibiotic modifying enzyme